MASENNMRDILDDIFRVGNIIRRTTNSTTRDHSISQLRELYDTLLEMRHQNPASFTDSVEKELVDLFQNDYGFLLKGSQKKYLDTFACLSIKTKPTVPPKQKQSTPLWAAYRVRPTKENCQQLMLMLFQETFTYLRKYAYTIAIPSHVNTLYEPKPYISRISKKFGLHEVLYGSHKQRNTRYVSISHPFNVSHEEKKVVSWKHAGKLTCFQFFVLKDLLMNPNDWLQRVMVSEETEQSNIFSIFLRECVLVGRVKGYVDMKMVPFPQFIHDYIR
jgi:hypothetical protein